MVNDKARRSELRRGVVERSGEDGHVSAKSWGQRIDTGGAGGWGGAGHWDGTARAGCHEIAIERIHIHLRASPAAAAPHCRRMQDEMPTLLTHWFQNAYGPGKEVCGKNIDS